MKSATKAVIAGVAGIALLAGGAGSLAFWTDTKPGTAVTINSGDLSLGNIADGATGWSLAQSDAPGTAAAGVPFTNQLIVPGDVLSKTVQVPVVLTGTDNKATLSVGAVKAGTGTDLVSALNASIVSVNGTAGATSVTLTPAQVAALPGGTVPVVFSITFPWTTGNAVAKAQQATYTASYTLTQVPASS
jgi:alternate signal-mediated exported protein